MLAKGNLLNPRERDNYVYFSMADQLSAELYLLIFSFATREDLKSIRQASKRFCELASGIFFRSVSVAIHMEDLINLRAIAESPTLSGLVQEIVYNASYFTMDGLREQGAFGECNCRLYLPKDPDPALLCYFDHLKEQKAALQYHIDQIIINAALKKLCNLREVVFANYRDQPITESTDKSPRNHRSFCRWHPECVVRPTADPGEFRSENNLATDHGFEVTCRALSKAGTKLQSLAIRYVPSYLWDEGLSILSFSRPQQVLAHYCNVFRHLRRLSLSLSMFVSPEAREAVRDGKIARVLGSAQLLEELHMNLLGMCRKGIPLKEIVGSHT